MLLMELGKLIEVCEVRTRAWEVVRVLWVMGGPSLPRAEPGSWGRTYCLQPSSALASGFENGNAAMS